MTTEALKSTPITNLDAQPPTVANTGAGASSRLKSVDGSVTPTTGQTSGSTYQLVRIPVTARMKHLWVGPDTAFTTFAGDVGFYYSTSDHDGTAKSSQGTKVGTGQEFGAAQDLHAAGLVDLIKNMSSTNRDLPAWQVAGLSKSPGGYFDIVITSTSTNSGTGLVYGEAVYEE